jgi:hypothetical protein
MMRRLVIATLFAAALTPPLLAAPPEAPHPPRLGGPLVDGSVIRTVGCGSHFFVAYRAEFALAEWLGGEMVKDGDVLEGTDDQASFEHEGRWTFTNLATSRTVDVVIEKALLNRADFLRTVAQVCR